MVRYEIVYKVIEAFSTVVEAQSEEEAEQSINVWTNGNPLYTQKEVIVIEVTPIIEEE